MRNLGVLSTTLSPWSHWSLNLSKGVAIGSIVFCLLLAACSDDSSKTAGGTEEDAGIVAIEDKTISGVSQKGPFVNGSSVTVYGLDGETLAQTGNIYEGKIKSDMGDFSVKVVKLASQYALLKANGFYRNEVTGEKSNSQMTLYALTDLSDRDEVNVNLLTHLAYERSLYLATDSLSVSKAKKQAEAEVFKSFEIEGDFGAAEDLNIFGENDQSAALLAISVLMQGDLKEADFSERLDNYARDIEEDGKWDDKKTATAIADWASEKSLNGGLATIRANVEKWGQLFGVPPFEKFVNNFWWQNYDLGICDKNRQGEIKTNDNALSVKNGVHFICDDNVWREATILEYDTYQKKCDEDGKIIFGKVNKDQPYDCDGEKWRKATDVEGILGGCIEKRFDEVVEALGSYYICESRQWREATDIEKDTYKWKPGNDADVKNGDVVKSNCYVFENNAWRGGNESDCSLDLRGCTALRQNTVGQGKDKEWYICDVKKWLKAEDIEKDTATWGAGKFDGEVRAGQVNKNIYYIYETRGDAWREATTIEKDTFGWEKENDGVAKKGNVTDTVYVFENGLIRLANARESHILEGCTNYNEGHINTKSDTSDYVCRQGMWKVKKNVLVDSRDNQSYEIVRIGKQVWMAQNLNYADSIAMENLKGASWCGWGYESCDYRFYAWSGAMNVSPEYQTKAYGQESVQGVCPEGWHLPSKREWSQLIEFVGGPTQAWYTLTYDGEYGLNATYTEGGSKSDLSCEEDPWLECCTGHSGFCVNEDKIYFWSSGGGFWWTSSEEGAVTAFDVHFAIQVDYEGDGGGPVNINKSYKTDVYPVRCVKDEE